MNLSELKQKSIVKLQKIATEMGIEGVSRSRKQDIIFSILKAHAKNGESIYGVGVLEILQDGLVSCAHRTVPTWPARMTFMSHPARFGDLPCVPATCWQVKFAHPRTANAILLY